MSRTQEVSAEVRLRQSLRLTRTPREDWEQDFSIETPHAAGDPASASDSDHDSCVEATEEVSAAAPVGSAVFHLDESIEEVRFYLDQGMTEQAELVLTEILEAIAPGAPELAVLRAGIDLR